MAPPGLYLLFTSTAASGEQGTPSRPRRSLARGPGPGPGVVTGVHSPAAGWPGRHGRGHLDAGPLKSDYISLLASGTYLPQPTSWWWRALSPW